MQSHAPSPRHPEMLQKVIYGLLTCEHVSGIGTLIPKSPVEAEVMTNGLAGSGSSAHAKRLPCALDRKAGVTYEAEA